MIPVKPVIEADLLIVGGGIAGLMAAIAAADKGASVTLLDKANTKRSGAGATGNDHFLCYIPEKHGTINVVYEDDQLMVINKEAGMVVHPGAGNFHGTLIQAVAWHLRDMPEFDANDPEVGLVHRIDKDTSGLLVVAKTPTAKTALGKQFFNKTTHRSYNALVWGNIVEDEGRIEGNIGRDPKNRLRMKVFDPDSGIGKSAVTHYKVLERFGYTTLVQCILETGRTHQIRAHMKQIGHPLFMDETYGGAEILRGQRSSSYKAFIQNCFKLCPRQALHAKTLGFVHPTTKEQMDFDSEWPEDFSKLIEKWRGFIAGTTQDTFKNI